MVSGIFYELDVTMKCNIVSNKKLKRVRYGRKN